MKARSLSRPAIDDAEYGLGSYPSARVVCEGEELTQAAHAALVPSWDCAEDPDVSERLEQLPEDSHSAQSQRHESAALALGYCLAGSALLLCGWAAWAHPALLGWLFLAAAGVVLVTYLLGRRSAH